MWTYYKLVKEWIRFMKDIQTTVAAVEADLAVVRKAVISLQTQVTELNTRLNAGDVVTRESADALDKLQVDADALVAALNPPAPAPAPAQVG